MFQEESAPLSAPLPVTAEAARETVDSPGRWTKAVLLLLVLIPTVFNAIALWPEVSLPIPSLNDDASHYLFIQRSSEALANGENPFDHWVPELEFGFPQFFYYQHLPHLAVVFLHRLLLKQVDLLTLLGLMTPALQERRAYYRLNTQWMERTRNALDVDADAPAIITAIKELPPGRTYAGLRTNNLGSDPKMKWADLRFTDLLTFTRVVAASPPYQGLSLSSDLIWHFDDRNPAQYDLLNVRYVVAPSGLAMAEFLRPIKTTPRYTLYQVETTGYAKFAAVARLSSVSSQARLFFQNRDWFLSGEPAAGKFVRYEYPAARDGSTSLEIPGCPDGVTRDERVLAGRIDLMAECPHASALVLKMTYHPNWRVAVDGVEVETFMVSPGFIGIAWPAGAHQIRAEYRSPVYKTALLLLGACTLMATIWFRRRFARLDAVFSSKP